MVLVYVPVDNASLKLKMNWGYPVWYSFSNKSGDFRRGSLGLDNTLVVGHGSSPYCSPGWPSRCHWTVPLQPHPEHWESHTSSVLISIPKDCRPGRNKTTNSGSPKKWAAAVLKPDKKKSKVTLMYVTLMWGSGQFSAPKKKTSKITYLLTHFWPMDKDIYDIFMTNCCYLLYNVWRDLYRWIS